MHPRSETEPPHPSPSLRPELVLLGLLIQQECHGYELRRRFNDTLAGLWHISESQLYATLKRLEEKRLLVASSSDKGSVASRRILSPTDAGKARFESWLTSPSPCRPRTLRLEFLTRLYFAKQFTPETVPGLIHDQRSSVLESLQRLQDRPMKLGHNAYAAERPSTRIKKPKSEGLDLDRLSYDFTIAQLRSALEWIDASIIPSIKEDNF